MAPKRTADASEVKTQGRSKIPKLDKEDSTKLQAVTRTTDRAGPKSSANCKILARDKPKKTSHVRSSEVINTVVLLAEPSRPALRMFTCEDNENVRLGTGKDAPLGYRRFRIYAMVEHNISAGLYRWAGLGGGPCGRH
jgi:hypothetical protein